jgi:protein-tyrosine phosphatase
MKSSLELSGTQPYRMEKHRRQLPFAKAKNFRDLGGYPTSDGRRVRWGVVYRSDSLHKLNEIDLNLLASLNLSHVFDFRSENEAEREPDRLPDAVKLVSLPMLDSSTKVWHDQRDELVKNMKSIDPAEFMLATNTELGTKFTPEYKRFYRELVTSNGRPVLFHCAAGKDRTGFAAASLLRILGVPQDVVMQDYLLTNRYFLDAYKWNLFVGSIVKGRKYMDGIRGFMKADESYLNAAFTAIQNVHGSFENYVHEGLELTEHDIERLKKYYLE